MSVSIDNYEIKSISDIDNFLNDGDLRSSILSFFRDMDEVYLWMKLYAEMSVEQMSVHHMGDFMSYEDAYQKAFLNFNFRLGMSVGSKSSQFITIENLLNDPFKGPTARQILRDRKLKILIEND